MKQISDNIWGTLIRQIHLQTTIHTMEFTVFSGVEVYPEDKST